MQVFVINLDGSRERMASIDAQLRTLGVPYERISAVYGKGLSREELRRSFSSFRWWCAVGYKAAPAEIGCALSHALIYKRMVAENLPVACILEDDVVLSPDFAARVGQAEKFMNAAVPQVVLLSDHTGRYKNRLDVPESGIVTSSCGMCTDGYCLTKAAAMALLRENYPVQVPCDWWGRWVSSGAISLYHALPSVVRQDQETFGGSTIDGRVVVAELPFIALCTYKAKRTIGKSIDCAWRCFDKLGHGKA